MKNTKIFFLSILLFFFILISCSQQSKNVGVAKIRFWSTTETASLGIGKADGFIFLLAPNKYDHKDGVVYTNEITDYKSIVSGTFYFYKNANTSPIKLSPSDGFEFSEGKKYTCKYSDNTNGIITEDLF